MRMDRLIAATAGTFLAGIVFSQAARADLLINVDQSSQRMLVSVNGQLLYEWPVSTGRPGYDTPDGTFRPFRMDIDHRSEEYDEAPMPYSIFFTSSGIAVHGTDEQSALGRPVSHGCVRLSVRNAAVLWGLVQQENMANTTVVVSGSTPGRGQVVADAAPMVLTPPADVGAPAMQPADGWNEPRRGLFASLFGQ